MFEEEAEEYLKKDGTETEKMLNNITLSLTSRQAFVLKNAFKQVFKDGAEFGYNKANEWHKADENPKVTKEYLVYLISGYNCRSVTMMIYNAERGFWCADNQNDVVYWKEIVLPELKESE